MRRQTYFHINIYDIDFLLNSHFRNPNSYLTKLFLKIGCGLSFNIVLTTAYILVPTVFILKWKQTYVNVMHTAKISLYNVKSKRRQLKIETTQYFYRFTYCIFLVFMVVLLLYFVLKIISRQFNLLYRSPINH